MILKKLKKVFVKETIKKYRYIIILVVLSLLLFLFKKKTNLKSMNLTEDDIIDKTIPFILKQEGGLSNHVNDSASSFPSPTPQKYHTNKGVTYRVFVDSASSLGYQPTIQNFLTMPMTIWKQIYKKKYYSQSTLTSEPLLKVYLSLWFWGGWNKKIVTTKQVTDICNLKIDVIQRLRKLVDLRIYYFNQLVKFNPSYSVFLKGWTNRANEFYNLFA